MKLYYTITEVAKIVGVKPHVLRYWESGFPFLKPKRRGGKRFYSPEDIKKILILRFLIHKEGFTLQGAKKKLRDEGVDELFPLAIVSFLSEIKVELEDILKELWSIMRELEDS